MANEALQQLLLSIADSISRKKGNVGVVSSSEGTVLAAGSFQAVKVPGGFVVTIGLTRERLRALRDECDEVLVAPVRRLRREIAIARDKGDAGEVDRLEMLLDELGEPAVEKAGF